MGIIRNRCSLWKGRIKYFLILNDDTRKCTKPQYPGPQIGVGYIKLKDKLCFIFILACFNIVVVRSMFVYFLPAVVVYRYINMYLNMYVHMYIYAISIVIVHDIITSVVLLLLLLLSLVLRQQQTLIVAQFFFVGGFFALLFLSLLCCWCCCCCISIHTTQLRNKRWPGFIFSLHFFIKILMFSCKYNECLLHAYIHM